MTMVLVGRLVVMDAAVGRDNHGSRREHLGKVQDRDILAGCAAAARFIALLLLWAAAA